MKILQINKYNYLRGGAEKYFLDLSIALEAAGHQVAKLSMHHPKNEPSSWEKYFVSRVSYNQGWLMGLRGVARMMYSLEAAKKMKQILDDFQPDIIHIHNIYHQLSPSILPIAKKRGIPVIMHLHDYKYFCPARTMYNRQGICEKCKNKKYLYCTTNKCVKDSWIKSFISSVEMFFHHTILKIYEKNIDLYIAPSQFIRNKAIEWGLPAEKIIFQPYLVNLEDFKPQLTVGDYLLYFGRLAEEKGLATLLKAIKDCPEEKLKIVGEGPIKKEIEDKINNLEISDRVCLLGARYGQELHEIISNAKAVVVPSQWYEVFGLVNVEANASGKPVIGSAVGGISELINEGENGFLFKMGDATDLAAKIKKLNQSNIEQLGKNGIKKSLIFNKKDHISNILEIYGRLVF